LIYWTRGIAHTRLPHRGAVNGGIKSHGEETQEGKENLIEKDAQATLRKALVKAEACSRLLGPRIGGRAVAKPLAALSVLMRTQRRPVPSVNPHFSRYRLQIRRSAIHRFGVFAAERIPRGRKVIEYTGQRISRRALLKRARKMSRAACRKLIYLACVNRHWTLDGGIGGSGAQFINHSCEPNLFRRRSHGHILLFSRRAIRKGEELTWDYRYPKKLEPVSCRCGAPNCRGTINLR